jgi:CBS domain containing-hemolysin-like protein
MPKVGDTFRMGDLRFDVVDLDRRRIDKVLIGSWTSAT